MFCRYIQCNYGVFSVYNNVVPCNTPLKIIDMNVHTLNVLGNASFTLLYNCSVYLTVTIKYAYLILRFCRLSHFAGINKRAMHVV